MTVKAKTLVKDKFWIVEEHGQKLGTLQKKDNNGWIFLNSVFPVVEYLTWPNAASPGSLSMTF